MAKGHLVKVSHTDHVSSQGLSHASIETKTEVLLETLLLTCSYSVLSHQFVPKA